MRIGIRLRRRSTQALFDEPVAKGYVEDHPS